MGNTADVVVAAKNTTGECPVWNDVAQALWWTDIPEKRLHRWNPSTSEHRTFEMPGRVGCFAFRKDHGFVLAMEQGFATWDPNAEALNQLAEPERGLADHRFNDGRCDRQGRFLAGSMNMARSGPTGQLWRLDPDGAVNRLAGNVTIANGLAFSPDGKLMYWADSPAECVYLFDYDTDTGTVANRRIWLSRGEAPGRPDGAAIDTDGCYWSARWGGSSVVRFTPSGAIDQIVQLPISRVTMCAFGGVDFRTLYITTARENMTPDELEREPLAGGLFAIRVQAQGLADTRFCG
jgi:L-arabinonolactonase